MPGSTGCENQPQFEKSFTLPSPSITNPNAFPILYFTGNSSVTGMKTSHNDGGNTKLRLVTKAPESKHQTTKKNSVTPFSSKPAKEEATEVHCKKLSITNTEDFDYSYSCDPFWEKLNVCKESSIYFRSTDFKHKSCSHTENKPICHFTNASRTNELTYLQIICDSDICGNSSINVESFDPKYGIVTDRQKSFKTIDQLRKGLRGEIEINLRHGFDYIFLSCGKKYRHKQALWLPPHIEVKNKLKEENLKQKPNINVIVIDSLSRHHLYRSMPQTVAAMLKVNSDVTDRDILDFELFQSLAPFTFVNVQSFMAGKQNYANVSNRDIDFSSIFSRFKKAGYQTLLQEDTCWYDRWGSILTSNKKRHSKLKHKEDFKREWDHLKHQMNSYFVDNFGLSHFSCEVLRLHGRTNMFNDDEKFCFDGKPLSAHFLAYLENILKFQQNTDSAKPLFAYTHLNIGHEKKGTRISLLDKYLANYITATASFDNTMTILWSDHGGKTTKYSINSLSGRFEIYDSFLFISIPGKLSKYLGHDLVSNLARNQRALVTAQDLHQTIRFLSAEKIPENDSPGSIIDFGLLSDKTSREDCYSLPMRNYGLCKCIQNYQLIDLKQLENKLDAIWLAEFALGELNNKMNQQLTKTSPGKFPKRSCLRLKGVDVYRLLFDAYKSKERFYFDVAVKGLSEHPEIFNFQVILDKNQTAEPLKLSFWQRMSIYQKFDSCRDFDISVELCICSKETEAEGWTMDTLFSQRMFGEDAIVLPMKLNSTCVFIIERRYSNSIYAYEVANICKDPVSIDFSVTNIWGWLYSKNIPMTFKAVPFTITFLVTVKKHQRDSPPFIPRIRIV